MNISIKKIIDNALKFEAYSSIFYFIIFPFIKLETSNLASIIK